LEYNLKVQLFDPAKSVAELRQVKHTKAQVYHYL